MYAKLAKKGDQEHVGAGILFSLGSLICMVFAIIEGVKVRGRKLSRAQTKKLVNRGSRKLMTPDGFSLKQKQFAKMLSKEDLSEINMSNPDEAFSFAEDFFHRKFKIPREFIRKDTRSIKRMVKHSSN